MPVTQRLLGPWPVLRSAQEVACYGVNPRSDDRCQLGEHQGHHQDEAGDRWLDDGDLAKPDWPLDVHDPRD